MRANHSMHHDSCLRHTCVIGFEDSFGSMCEESDGSVFRDGVHGMADATAGATAATRIVC
jgi:hypothetical protein